MNLTANGRVELTTRDVVTFERCPWAWVNSIAVIQRGHYPPPPLDNTMRELMAETSHHHRERVRSYLRTSHGAVGSSEDTPLVDQISQHGSLLDPSWSWEDPHSPFTVTARMDGLISGDRGAVRMVASKLGHSSMRALLLSSAGALDGLRLSGIDAESTLEVLFGDGETDLLDLSDSRELWRQTLGQMSKAYQDYREGASYEWWSSPFDQCGRLSCEWCQDALSRNDDLFHIARIRRLHRAEIRRRGIQTMTDFATSTIDELVEQILTVPGDDLRRLQLQASLQVLSTHDPDGAPPIQVVDPGEIAALPHVRDGDLYLDFESNPGYTEWPPLEDYSPGAVGPSSWLGLEYLIGVLESSDESYRYWWSDSFSSEEEAFRKFLDEILSRHRHDSHFRVFHYAPYEIQALRRLTTRHLYGAEALEELLSGEVFVDLYKVVMRAVAIGTPSYSLKKLEPLYLPAESREGISAGAESVEAFIRYHALRESEPDTATAIREDILRYNRVDCLSTKRLHQWLVGLTLE